MQRTIILSFAFIVFLAGVAAQHSGDSEDPLAGLVNLFHLLSVQHYRESVLPVAGLKHWANDEDGKHICVWLSLPNVEPLSVNLVWASKKFIIIFFPLR